MKQNGFLLLLAVAVLAVLEGRAQTIPDPVEVNKANFPDQIFRNYVSEHFDTDGDGVLSADGDADSVGIGKSVPFVASKTF